VTLVIAHRGARSVAPENTMAAVRAAFDAGADLWETDINVTRDGQLILFHDETLLRCTDAATKFPSRSSYLVRDFSLDEILSLDAGSHFIDSDPFSQISENKISDETLLAFKNEPIPTLEQGLLFTKEKDWKVNLELKYFGPTKRSAIATNDLAGSPLSDANVPDKTLNMIRSTKFPLNQFVISSFNHDWLLRVLEKEPDIEVQATVGPKGAKFLDFGDFFFPTYNANSLLITEDHINQLKARGKKINLFNVNRLDEFKRFVNLGVDGVITDFPQLLVGDDS
jgi:glycerophosphoryl diester phosphodiesterase